MQPTTAYAKLQRAIVSGEKLKKKKGGNSVDEPKDRERGVRYIKAYTGMVWVS